MHDGGDRGADEEGSGRHADDGLSLACPPGGYRLAQMVQGAVTRLHLLDRLVQQPPQCQLVRVELPVEIGSSGP